MRRLLTAALTATLLASLLPLPAFADAGVPDVVSFLVNPSSPSSGAPFADPPVVHVVDSLGDPVVGTGVTLSLTSGTGTLGAVMTCAVNPVNTDASGDATFLGCNVDLVGTGYTLTVTTTVGAITATSTSFDITPGPADHLVVSATTPQVAGAAFNVTVTAKDANENTATGYTGTVHLTSTDGGASLPADYTFTGPNAGTHALAVTFSTAGSWTVTATDTVTGSIAGTTDSLAVNAFGSTSQTITFGVLPGKTYGAAPFAVSATGGGSSAPVEFASTTAGTCSVSGTTVTILHAGDCTVQATQLGDPTYATATPVDRTFTIAKASLSVTADPQSITFGDSDPSFTFAYGTFAYTDDAADLDTAPTCTVSGAHTSVSGSPYTIACSGGADADYTFGYTGSTLTIGKADQTVTITSTKPTDAVVGGAGYTPTATATSALTVSFTVDAISSAVCAISAGTVSFAGPGTCTLNAAQAGNTDWNAAPLKTESFTVAQFGSTSQTITFGVLPGKTYGAAPFAVSATGGGSSAPVEFASTTAGTCSVSGTTVTILHAGDCTVQATQLGDPTYATATPVDRTFTIAKASLSVTADPQSITFGDSDPSFTFAYGTFAYTDDAADLDTAPTCTVSGAHTSVSGSPYTIACSGGADADYTFGYTGSTLTIGKADQTVTIDSTPPVAPKHADTYDITATATSGLEVAFAVDPASSAVCSIVGATVTFDASGSCTINATQAGNADWNEATPDSLVIAVDNAAPVCPSDSATVVMNVAATGSADCTDDQTLAADLAYDIAVDGDHGHAVIAADGTWTYTPDTGYTGDDAFQVVANDGAADSAPATVSITVVNAVVNAGNDSRSVAALVAGTLTLLSNDTAGIGDAGQPFTIASVTQGSKGTVSITPGGGAVVYDPRGCSYGSDVFTYTISDGVTFDTASVLVTITRPAIHPVTDTPTSSIVSGGTLGTSNTVPVRVAWCGVTRTGTSVNSYTVLQSTNGGTSYASTPIISATAAASSTRNLLAGITYRWKARTKDSGGHFSLYTASATARLVRYQETHTSIAYAHTWRSTSSSSYSGGAMRYTTSAGATATITVNNVRQFAIVGPKSSTRGSFEVWVDGTKVATVSERQSTTAYRKVLYVRSLTSGVGVTHTIRIVKTAGTARVDLDAIITLQ